MARHFDANIKDLLVSEGIASETTAATFFASASNKEVQLLKEDGSAVPDAAGNKFYILNKKANGSVIQSDIIDGGKIISVSKKDSVTQVPEYNYFAVNTTGCSVGDQASVFMKYWGTGTTSEMDWKFKTITYTLEDTVALNIANGIAKQIFRNLSEDWYYNTRPKFLHNAAGYDKVYATEAAAVADKASLTDTKLIWIIANDKAYTVADKTETTFAAIATEKTDWSTEIGAETAEYVDDARFYRIVVTDAGAVYIIAKELDRVLDKFDGEPSVTYVGATVHDPVAADNSSVQAEWGVTRIGRVINPCSGKRLASLEAHLDKKIRQYGAYNYKEFPFTPNIVEATNYTVVTIEYEEMNRVRKLTANPQRSTIMIAFDDSTEATTVYDALVVVKG